MSVKPLAHTLSRTCSPTKIIKGSSKFPLWIHQLRRQQDGRTRRADPREHPAVNTGYQSLIEHQLGGEGRGEGVSDHPAISGPIHLQFGELF